MNQPFTIFKRQNKSGSVYYVRFRGQHGERMTARSTGQTSKGAATTWAMSELRRMQLADGTIVPTFREWGEPFWGEECPRCTRLAEEGRPIGAAYRQGCRRSYELYIATDPIVDKKLNDITRGDVLEYRRRRLADGTPRYAINKALIVMKVMLKEAVYSSVIGSNPCVGVGSVTVPARQADILGGDDVTALFDASNWSEELAFVAFCILVFTGMRTGELRALTWGQIDFGSKIIVVNRAVKAKTMTVGPTKTFEDRNTALPDPLARALLNLYRKVQPKSTDRIISEADGSICNATWFYRRFKRAQRKIGIDTRVRKISVHSIRALVTTMLVEQGVPEAKIMASLGWTKVETMKRHYVKKKKLNLSLVGLALEKLALPEGGSHDEGKISIDDAGADDDDELLDAAES